MSCGQKGGCCMQQDDSMDYLVCTCMGVLKSEIQEAIANGNQSFQDLSDKLGVGTGCSSCVQEVLQLLKQAQEKKCCKS